jgi:hypothetical protein
MPKTLNEFYSRLINQGVKLQHQFQLSIIGAPDTGGTVDRLLEDITMWAQGADVPGRTQNTSDIQYLGYPFNVPTNFTMTNTLELTINSSQDMGIRDALFFWKGLISDPHIEGGSTGGGIKTASTAQGILDLYNQTMDTPTHTYELVGIYPIVVGDATMSNVDPGIVTFPVTFKYQYWKLVKQPNFSS